MLRRVKLWLLVLVALVIAVNAADAQEKRIALLIGNQAYKPGVGSLVNPLNDIRVVGEALKAVGFEVLKPAQNARRADMLLAVHDFAAKLKAGGSDAVGFLYYSGHGIASAGENYLIPVDVDEPSTRQLSVQGVKHSEVLAILRNEAPNAAHYLVLDACRNVLQGVRGAKGFVPVGQQSGVLVAFAAEPGKTASDIGQGSGPYAAALAAELVKPGQSDLIMFHNVRVAVMDKTRGDQVPWTEDGIQRRQRVLFGGESKPAPLAVTSSPSRTEVAQFCQSIATNPSIAIVQSLVETYKGTPMAACAQARLEELKRAQVAIATPPPRPTPVKPAQPAVSVTPAPAHCDGVQVTVGASERRCLKPGAGNSEQFKDCPTCPEMVMVPAGRFTMGSPKDEPEREAFNKGSEDQLAVTIVKPFAVGRFAVTRGEFAAFVTATGHKTDGSCFAYTGTDWKEQADRDWRTPGFTQTDRHPVVCVNWNDTKAYVAWLVTSTGQTYRLLSEAEREFAARAGTTTPFWWGSTISTSQANYNGDYTYAGGSKGGWRKATVSVDSFAANSWGLYNVHGNVWEWTEDCWNASNAGNPGNGEARSSGDCSLRVLRGGSWNNYPQNLRSANRIRYQPVNRYIFIGFRVARTL